MLRLKKLVNLYLVFFPLLAISLPAQVKISSKVPTTGTISISSPGLQIAVKDTVKFTPNPPVVFSIWKDIQGGIGVPMAGSNIPIGSSVCIFTTAIDKFGLPVTGIPIIYSASDTVIKITPLSDTTKDIAKMKLPVTC